MISLSPLETLSSDLLNLADQTAVYNGVGAMATVLRVFTTVTAKAKIRVETSGDVNSQTESPTQKYQHFLKRRSNIYGKIIQSSDEQYSYLEKDQCFLIEISRWVKLLLIVHRAIKQERQELNSFFWQARWGHWPLHEYFHVENNFK